MKTLQSPGDGAAGPLADQVATRGPWFHNLHLPDGTQTAPDHPLGDFPRRVWAKIAPELPDDLSGCRALDIGCNAGFHAFELADRGADVLAVDIDPHYLEQARWAADHLDPDGRVTFERRQVYELRDTDDSFDVVFMMGLLYHLRYPLLALDIVGARADDWLVFQSLTVPGDQKGVDVHRVEFDERERMRRPGWPTLAFVEDKLAGDPTNWWVPNPACCRALLRHTGFAVTAELDDEIYVCRREADREVSARRHREEFLAATGGEEA